MERRSDRKTNGSSLVSRHCVLFLNLAQTVRFKTKLVAGIFSRPFLKCCHLVGLRKRCVMCGGGVCASVGVCVRPSEGV